MTETEAFSSQDCGQRTNREILHFNVSKKREFYPFYLSKQKSVFSFMQFTFQSSFSLSFCFCVSSGQECVLQSNFSTGTGGRSAGRGGAQPGRSDDRLTFKKLLRFAVEIKKLIRSSNALALWSLWVWAWHTWQCRTQVESRGDCSVMQTCSWKCLQSVQQLHQPFYLPQRFKQQFACAGKYFWKVRHLPISMWK